MSARRIDTNTSDDDNPNYRGLLLAREIRRHAGNPIFAPAPLLEQLKTVLLLAATDLIRRSGHCRDPKINDRVEVFKQLPNLY